jgi:dihydrofolate reductase
VIFFFNLLATLIKIITMRKLILGLAVSLDGFIEGPNGEFDWCFTDQDYGMSEFFKRIDAVFFGRKSYEIMQNLGETGAIPGMPDITEYIFSNTLKQAKSGSVIVGGNIKEHAEKIKKEKGKDIWLFGGASLTASLMQMGLVDELWLSVHPILLGSGKPLFTGIRDRIKLTLVEEKSYSTGLVSLKYLIDK